MPKPTTSDADAVLNSLRQLQECSPPLDAVWLERLSALTRLAASQPAAIWSRLNSKDIWGGADSLANQALNPNSGYDPVMWQFQVRRFRELMIDLGELLQARGRHYPDIDSWLLAFNNWNKANV